MVISGVLFSLLCIYADLLWKTPLLCNHLLKILCGFNWKRNVKLHPTEFQLGWIYRWRCFCSALRFLPVRRRTQRSAWRGRVSLARTATGTATTTSTSRSTSPRECPAQSQLIVISVSVPCEPRVFNKRKFLASGTKLEKIREHQRGRGVGPLLGGGGKAGGIFNFRGGGLRLHLECRLWCWCVVIVGEVS